MEASAQGGLSFEEGIRKLICKTGKMNLSCCCSLVSEQRGAGGRQKQEDRRAPVKDFLNLSLELGDIS